MRKKLLIFLFCFALFSFPCFASNGIDDNLYYVQYYYPYSFEDNIISIYTFNEYIGNGVLSGEIKNYDYNTDTNELIYKFTCSSAKMLGNGQIYTMWYSNNSSLYNDGLSYGHIVGDSVISGGTVNPPTSAPVVDYNLSTESVLSVIIQLIPTILAFLVLYWGFWKGYSMLLRALGKA